MRETNGSFDSCNSCKRLVSSRLHELHKSNIPFVSRIEFIRSKLSNFSAHVCGVTVTESERIRDSIPAPGDTNTQVALHIPGWRDAAIHALA